MIDGLPTKSAYGFRLVRIPSWTFIGPDVSPRLHNSRSSHSLTLPRPILRVVDWQNALTLLAYRAVQSPGVLESLPGLE